MNQWMNERWSEKEQEVREGFLDSAFGFCYFMLSYLSVILIRQAVLWWKAAAFSFLATWTLRALRELK